MHRSFRRQLAIVARMAGAAVLTTARVLWGIARQATIGILNVLAALLIMFEEWGWRPLSHALARLARFPFVAALESWIAGLPPYGALCAFAVPSAVLIPAKLLGVYFLATGHLISALLVIVAAKIVSTALIARVFLLTRPALMQIAWFRHAHDVFVPWYERITDWIRSSWAWRYGRLIKERVRALMRRSWRNLRPWLDRAAAMAHQQLSNAWHAAVLARKRLVRHLPRREP